MDRLKNTAGLLRGTGRKYRLEPEGDLFRVVALRDIPLHRVAAGDQGGFVSGPANLSQHDSAWVSPEARIADHGYVFGNALVAGRGTVSGNGSVGGCAQVRGSGMVTGNARARGHAVVEGTIRGDAWLGGRARTPAGSVLSTGYVGGHNPQCRACRPVSVPAARDG